MRWLKNRIPPPLVAALFGLLMWLAARQLPGGLILPIKWRAGLALVVLLAGVAICLAGVLSFRNARTTVNPLKPETASALVTTRATRCTWASPPPCWPGRSSLPGRRHC